ncbi:magnesium/cobalt transporter CorA [Halodesulfovibrio aestuarii]|uniref:Magnesium transport protein CorA n=1 Tax=Halodesulfovibrio aestuarii TaxID=126333 RepID=A0A8G2FB81_9BACT|nr:magnesium/cobalt transporter CorA [Halodesulfovibrio aestuarii]SHJ27174.1 magnesium transporter [Halodesulfovibrio aestuarii]
MARFLNKQDEKIGHPPGALIFVGQQKTEQPRIRLIDYDQNMLRDEFVDSIETLSAHKFSGSTSWLNVDGLHASDLMASIGSTFNISSLVLEDIINTGQRPKIDESAEAIFISLKMLSYDPIQTTVNAEQLSAVLTENLLLTFQEQPGSVFEPVRERIRRKNGRIRSLGPDYLLYTLLDCVFENYLKIVETMGEKIEEFDEEILTNPTQELLEKINFYKHEMAYIRKAVRPAREIVLKLVRIENELISPEISPFLRDLSDMSEQTVDAVEVYREMLNGHLNIYNMTITNRLNDVMKFLTVFATIFIPLSFLAGIYGMNFEVMPELHYQHGYYMLLSVMVLVVLLMLAYFKKKNWL